MKGELMNDIPEKAETNQAGAPVINTPGDLYDACLRGVETIRLPSIQGRGSVASRIRAKQEGKSPPPIQQPRRPEQNRLWTLVRDRYPDDLKFCDGYRKAFTEVVKQYGGCDVQRVRRMSLDKFCEALDRIPSPRTAAVAEVPSAPLSEGETEIISFFQEVGHRMTKTKFFQEAALRGKIFAEGTVSPKLVELKKRGILNNKQDVSPKGYGLTEWAD